MAEQGSPSAPGSARPRAARVTVSIGVGAPALRDAVIERARSLGLLGWARVDGEAGVRIHAEGAPSKLEALLEAVGELAAGAEVGVEPVRVEGHEQFAARGVSAGVFVVQEHAATAHHFDVRLEVGGVMRSWAVPKGPSLDPAVKRLAVEVPDHSLAHNEFEGTLGDGGVIIWDRGTYEQGGRVPWPQALERGHAVFVLHGEKLRGGFALQRTGGGGGGRDGGAGGGAHGAHGARGARGARGEERGKASWLLIKRRDVHARPGSDIAAERPESVVSGRTLDELLG